MTEDDSEGFGLSNELDSDTEIGTFRRCTALGESTVQIRAYSA